MIAVDSLTLRLFHNLHIVDRANATKKNDQKIAKKLWVTSQIVIVLIQLIFVELSNYRIFQIIEIR